MKAPYPNLYQDKALFKAVMEDLVSEDILDKYEMTPKKEGKKIVDWRFDLYASNTFAKQVAANNKVANNISGLPNCSESAYDEDDITPATDQQSTETTP